MRDMCPIFVGYTTRACPVVTKIIRDQFAVRHKAREGTSFTKFDVETDEGYEVILQSALSGNPATALLGDTFLVDKKNNKVIHWKVSDVCDKENDSIAAKVGSYLLKAYPDEWTYEVNTNKPSKVVFIGFEVARFLRFLGLECSLTKNKYPLPLSMWLDGYNNRNYIELRTILFPDGQIPESKVAVRELIARRIPEDSSLHKSVLPVFTYFFENPVHDASIATEMSVQLGILSS
jgi:hypothetical protein